MTNQQKADLIFIHVLAPKFQEALDNVSLNKDIYKQEFKASINALNRHLERVIALTYKDINEEEEAQLRALTSAIDEGLESFKSSIKQEYEKE